MRCELPTEVKIELGDDGKLALVIASHVARQGEHAAGGDDRHGVIQRCHARDRLHFLSGAKGELAPTRRCKLTEIDLSGRRFARRKNGCWWRTCRRRS